MFKSNISFAEKQLLYYLPKAGKYYELNRNYSEDSSSNKTTSLLSPFIRYRLISEENVLKKVLEKYELRDCEKFVQEIYWRTYWKGWLEHRPSVYSDYLEDRNKLIEELGNKKFYLNAISGNTNLSFFNKWVNTLKEDGYLHNHVRMWFASIWIFTLKLPWQLGADFFMQHLLDGDPASNTLSWRWVAGIQTKGKNYLARKSNIEKYSNIKISNNEILNENAIPLIEDKIYNVNELKLNYDYNLEDIEYIIIPTDDLNILKDLNHKKVKVFTGLSKEDYNDHSFSEKVINHIKDICISNFNDDNFYNNIQIDIEFENYFDNLDNWISKYQIKEIYLPYVTQGNWKKIYKKIIKKYPSINFINFNRKYDVNSWIFSKKGYFKFKQNIPKLITDI